MLIFNYLFILNILGEYLSSKKLLDSNLESSTRVTRVTRHSPIDQSIVDAAISHTINGPSAANFCQQAIQTSS